MLPPVLSPLASAGVQTVFHPIGFAWATGWLDPAGAVLLDLDALGLAPRLSLERGEQDWSLASWMDWREEQGCLLRVLALPPRSGSAVTNVGDNLLLQLSGSSENGCTDPSLLAEVIPDDDGTIPVLVEGVLSFARPWEGTL